MAFGMSWWMVQQVIGDAALRLPDMDLLAPGMLGIDEHRYRSMRFFQDPGTKAWTRYEPWITGPSHLGMVALFDPVGAVAAGRE